MTVDDGNFERTKDCDSLITDSPHRARVRGETASELQWQAHDYDERSDNAHLVSTTDKVSVSYAKRAGSPAGIVYGGVLACRGVKCPMHRYHSVGHKAGARMHGVHGGVGPRWHVPRPG